MLDIALQYIINVIIQYNMLPYVAQQRKDDGYYACRTSTNNLLAPVAGPFLQGKMRFLMIRSVE